MQNHLQKIKALELELHQAKLDFSKAFLALPLEERISFWLDNKKLHNFNEYLLGNYFTDVYPYQYSEEERILLRTLSTNQECHMRTIDLNEIVDQFDENELAETIQNGTDFLSKVLKEMLLQGIGTLYLDI